MTNFLNQLENPQINYERFFEVMRDFRKGGINPSMYDEFLETIKHLPSLYERKVSDYDIFNRFNLTDITEDDFSVIMREVIKRGIENSKVCWHPNANSSTCNVNSSGKIIVSAAHSIQNNGVLSKIVENGHVMSYAFDKGEFEGKQLGKNHASIFWGFCNTHDSIFRPIENHPYTGSSEQNFLFAYRGFVVAAHKKVEVSNYINYGGQSDKDIIENKKLFDKAITANDYSLIETEVFELSAFYPIAVSSSFYLDFDFKGNPIAHSKQRMEGVFVTLFPTENKTYFLLSFFKQDKNLYGNLGNQLRKRNKLKSDISMLMLPNADKLSTTPTQSDKELQEQVKILKSYVCLIKVN